MALLEALVRGHDRVGLAEARAVMRPEPSGKPHPRLRAAIAAAAAICVAFGGLWFSLGGRGPVLGSGDAVAKPSAAAVPTAPAASAAPAVSTVPAAPAINQPVGQAAGGTPSTEGLTLRPRGDDDAGPEAAAAGKATLTGPGRDLGPAVRVKVETPQTRPMLRQDGPEAQPATGLRAENRRTESVGSAESAGFGRTE